jgi:23S rRNA U2552 (ribose-2'-O)-methylase RlmE/FtsJ
MQVFKLPFLSIINDAIEEPVAWDIHQFESIAHQTNMCKSQIDKPYKSHKKEWDLYTRQMEPSNFIKMNLIKKYRPQFVTNAFLKLIEMNVAFHLIKDTDIVRLFDNASAPGAFIMAANYWVSTMTHNKLDWIASTLISTDENTALGDSYGLARLHPHRYATNQTKFDGDTTNVQYLRYVQKKYGNSVDTYVSDLGMYVGENEYNMQEAINAKGNLGQYIMGLIVLKKNGNFLIKQYNHYSAFTVSLMGIISMCFKQTYIVKPITSKSDNSEEYIIGKSFLGVPQIILDIMLDRLEQPWEFQKEKRNFAIPLLPESLISDEFKDAAIHAASTLADRQCEKINANVTEFARMIESGDKKPSHVFMQAHVYKHANDWFNIAKFKYMEKKSFLRVTSMRY